MASFTASIYATSATTAYINASFVGGSSDYKWDNDDYKPRYVKLTLNGVEYEDSPFEAPSEGYKENGTVYTRNDLAQSISGLEPGTTYSWVATLGYVNNSGGVSYLSNYSASGAFTTDAEKIDVEPWSWSGTQRSNFYKMLHGQLPVDYADADVWNDIVDKIDEVLNAMDLYWQSNYATKANTKASAGKSLSAVMYNSARHNISRLSEPDRDFVDRGERIYGEHFTALTDAINRAIG